MPWVIYHIQITNVSYSGEPIWIPSQLHNMLTQFHMLLQVGVNMKKPVMV